MSTAAVVAPPSSDIDRILEAQRANAPRIAATGADVRIAKIRKILDATMARRKDIRKALWDDFRKPAAEVDLTEIYAVTTEAKHAIRHLRSWMRPQKVKTPLQFIGSASRIVYEPKGVVLIISPWNFPYNLTFGPLVSAIAAGNCAVLKPSELTPRTSALMKEIMGGLFSEDEVAVIEGDASTSTELLKRRWDHIFFTGSPNVGKVVMRAAAEYLTPVTLELGGKSPVIIDRTANIRDAAKKVAWVKFVNVGQICVAPDYVYVDETVKDEFLEEVKKALDAFGGPDGRPLIVNERHAQRVGRMLDDSIAAGARVVNLTSSSGRELAPTILTNVSPEAPVMREEIFGPILPVLSYRERREAYEHIARHEKPLALYIFSRDRDVVDEIMQNTTAGGTAINHVALQFFQPYLPFGGVGNSGVGKGHGFFGFSGFSNPRGVYDQVTPFSAMDFLMPPYNAIKQKMIDLTLKFF